MWPDRVSNPGPLTFESCALPTALRSPATKTEHNTKKTTVHELVRTSPTIFNLKSQTAELYAFNISI